MKKLYEVEVAVFGKRSEIYHIEAASEQAAREESLNGFTHPINENYMPEDHTREVVEVEEIVRESNYCKGNP